MLAAASFKPCSGTCFLFKSSSDAAGFGAVAGILPGLFAGAILGSGIKTERWGPVSGESVNQFRIVPVGKGVVAQLSLSFY